MTNKCCTCNLEGMGLEQFACPIHGPNGSDLAPEFRQHAARMNAANVKDDPSSASAQPTPEPNPNLVGVVGVISGDRGEARDAARYRWLREQHDNEDAELGVARLGRYGVTFVDAGGLDAAIDAAIEAAAASGEGRP